MNNVVASDQYVLRCWGKKKRTEYATRGGGLFFFLFLGAVGSLVSLVLYRNSACSFMTIKSDGREKGYPALPPFPSR